MNNQVRAPLSLTLSLVLAVVPVMAASVIGSMATLPNIPTWYLGLIKPSFTPPNWIFGPVWTLLYAAMAFAFYRILRKPGDEGRGSVIAAFMIQIALNGAWSVVFFGLRNPLLGLIVIVPLWLTIAWTLTLFWKRDRISGGCFVPYLAWVSFAAALNLEIWRLNG